jgi:GNAT superfamily N-acetyltransferase
VEIERVDEPAAADIQFLRDRIDEFNVAATGFDDGRWLTFLVREATTTVAGLHGWTWGGSGWIELLWVADALRSTGLGSELLVAAEAEAVSRGCTMIALSTHTFQARPFYERHGYKVVGFLPDYPPGHGDFTMRKTLPGRAGP